MKDCNVMIDGCNVFDKPLSNKIRTHDNIRKIFPYFKENYKLIATDLSKLQALHTVPQVKW